FGRNRVCVPRSTSGTVSVVRDSTGAVLATLTGNGLGAAGPESAAFDGQRVLVANYNQDNVSLWKAADLTPLGSVPTGAGTVPYGACSDGVNFWVTLNTTGRLVKF